MKRAHELEIGEEVRVIRTGGKTDLGWEVMGFHHGRVMLTKMFGGQLYSKNPRYETFNKWQEQIHFDLTNAVDEGGD